ncbi:PPA1309 family protein [Ornithinimicrobium sp. F0845]|uniref:PPA1309 family protein n=1 Tax=Ornithinimicrobium sp. F0845 TaxID=2926412 RepID=UPI001FF6D391|nr:PPA1309 family protein [Ornithinimicrobium sp. F0845]
MSDLAQILTQAAADTERHVARLGWDQAPRLFALVRTDSLRNAEPGLRDQLAGSAPESLTSIEQEGLRKTSNIETMLGTLAWPEGVDGAAIALERIVVPPEAERDLPLNPTEATEALAAHPARKDVRLLAAVLRTGESVCLLRQRDHDSDDAVAIGADIAPGLVAALRATLTD